jgi:hypothetical protein
MPATVPIASQITMTMAFQTFSATTETNPASVLTKLPCVLGDRAVRDTGGHQGCLLCNGSQLLFCKPSQRGYVFSDDLRGDRLQIASELINIDLVHGRSSYRLRKAS